MLIVVGKYANLEMSLRAVEILRLLRRLSGNELFA